MNALRKFLSHLLPSPEKVREARIRLVGLSSRDWRRMESDLDDLLCEAAGLPDDEEMVDLWAATYREVDEMTVAEWDRLWSALHNDDN